MLASMAWKIVCVVSGWSRYEISQALECRLRARSASVALRQCRRSILDTMTTLFLGPVGPVRGSVGCVCVGFNIQTISVSQLLSLQQRQTILLIQLPTLPSWAPKRGECRVRSRDVDFALGGTIHSIVPLTTTNGLIFDISCFAAASDWQRRTVSHGLDIWGSATSTKYCILT
jgi:hypothetical protein